MDSNNPSAVRPSVHWSFWAVAALALIWHLPAIANVVMQMNTDVVAASDDPMQKILAQRPGWATVGFAVFAVAGSVGALLLLLRKKAAIYLFALSLVGVVVHFLGLLGIENVPTAMTMGCVMSLIGAAFFIWYSRLVSRRRWIH